MLPAHGRRLEDNRFSLPAPVRSVVLSSRSVAGPRGFNPQTLTCTLAVQKLDGLRRLGPFGGDARRIPLATPNSPL